MAMFLKKIIFSVITKFIKINDLILLKRGKKIISVLCYHRINDLIHDQMTVSTDTFEEQIKYLTRNYKVISVHELYKKISDGQTSDKGGKFAVITFDDGYRDNLINAMPILKKYNCPAIFFVSTNVVGIDKTFAHDKVLYPGLDVQKMTWDDLKEAASSNIWIGIHSDTHINLGTSSYEDATNDINESIMKYRNVFDKNGLYMAYPFGGPSDINDNVINYIKNNTKIALLFSAYGGRNISPIDKYNIKRVFIGNADTGVLLRYRVEGGWRALFGKNSIRFK